jgi:glycerol-3-phosphate dehydrogenase (NAD(P)+)
MMGTAMSWPLTDNHNHVRLIRPHFDEGIITSIRHNGYHPTLKRHIAKDVELFYHTQLDVALDRVDVSECGVSSFGNPWFAQRVGPYLIPEVSVIAVTKGLEDQQDGDLLILPDSANNYLPGNMRGRASINAIAGPCIAHELATRRQTCVVFCGKDAEALFKL